jgi:excisionase family DNA binding protein
LNTSVRHLRRLVDEGRIPFHKVGWFVRFDQAEIAVWLEGNSRGQFVDGVAPPPTEGRGRRSRSQP